MAGCHFASYGTLLAMSDEPTYREFYGGDSHDGYTRMWLGGGPAEWPRFKALVQASCEKLAEHPEIEKQYPEARHLADALLAMMETPGRFESETAMRDLIDVKRAFAVVTGRAYLELGIDKPPHIL